MPGVNLASLPAPGGIARGLSPPAASPWRRAHGGDRATAALRHTALAWVAWDTFTQSVQSCIQHKFTNRQNTTGGDGGGNSVCLCAQLSRHEARRLFSSEELRRIWKLLPKSSEGFGNTPHPCHLVPILVKVQQHPSLQPLVRVCVCVPL